MKNKLTSEGILDLIINFFSSSATIFPSYTTVGFSMSDLLIKTMEGTLNLKSGLK